MNNQFDFVKNGDEQYVNNVGPFKKLREKISAANQAGIFIPEPGTTPQPNTGGVMPQETLPTTQPPVTNTQTEIPESTNKKWLKPVLISVGVIGILAIIYFVAKKKQ